MLTPQFVTKTVETSESYGVFSMEPLTKSFGESMGNALRRTLLSALEGTAVTAVKVDAVPHLFSALKGVKETALELTLNLKQVRFKRAGEGVHKVTLLKKGIGKVFASDLEGDVEVVNGDLYLGEITDAKGKIELEALVENGRGYVLADDQSEKETGFIVLDSAFSPVKKVNFAVEEARVGRKTDADRLVLNVWTDGSISPENAIKEAAQILQSQFSYVFAQSGAQAQKTGTDAEATSTQEIDKKFHDLIIDELNLPSRVVNALLRENIETVADLVRVGEEKLVAYKGLGRKSIDLIKDELKKLGFEWK